MAIENSEFRIQNSELRIKKKIFFFTASFCYDNRKNIVLKCILARLLHVACNEVNPEFRILNLNAILFLWNYFTELQTMQNLNQ